MFYLLTTTDATSVGAGFEPATIHMLYSFKPFLLLASSHPFRKLNRIYFFYYFRSIIFIVMRRCGVTDNNIKFQRSFE